MSPSIISAIALIVGILIWLYFSDRRSQRRRLRNLSESGCPACGILYGPAAAERARQEFLARCAEARDRHPHCKINFAHYWEIRCAQCGAEARFDYVTESLASHTA